MIFGLQRLLSGWSIIGQILAFLIVAWQIYYSFPLPCTVVFSELNKSQAVHFTPNNEGASNFTACIVMTYEGRTPSTPLRVSSI